MKIAILLGGLALVILAIGWWAFAVTGDLAGQDIGAAPWIVAGAAAVAAVLAGLFVALSRRK